jgi:predicted nucleic acid-binding protein
LPFYFLDTSALVKLYIQGPGSDRLLSLVDGARASRFAVLSLTIVELRSALRRRQRDGDIDADTADAILASLTAHMETWFLRQAVNDAVLDLAVQMVDRHALRAYDAVQLAGCLALSSNVAETSTFICSDRRLLEAARSEQLYVLDPTVCDVGQSSP